MSVTAVLSVNMVTASMLLSVFFVSGALADCPKDSGLFITAPQKMEALSGSCLLIPCTFRAKPEQEFDNSREIFGVWIKNDSRFVKNVILNSIQDSPPSPRIEISGDLKEKESVSITCSAFTPCPHSPPKLTWNLQQDSHNKIQENTDGTFTTKIQKTITLSDQHDGYNITCSVTYPVNEGKHVKTAEQRKTLSVSYLPRDTSVVISPTGPVSVGSLVNLTCSCRGNPPPVHFVWFKMSDSRLMLISADTKVYSFRVSNSDRDRLFFCGCRNDLDFELSTGRQLIFEDDQKSELVGIQVIVKILGIMMLINSPLSPRIEISGDLKEKESVSITCSAFTPCPHSPPKLTWNLQQDSHNKIQENTDGTFTTKIQKTITLSDQQDGYNITCSVTYPVNEGKHVKTAEQRKTLSVSYAPKDTSVSISPSGLVSAGSWVILTCSSRAKPPVSRFTWFKISKDGPMTVSEGPFYSVNVTDVEDYYYCVATNDLDSPPSPRIKISGDLKEKESVSITCSAFTPCPHSPPKLTWNLQQDSHNKIQENTDGTFTTKLQKTITLSDQQDGYNITCSVTYPVNEGKHVKTAEQRKTLSVSYAPKDTSVSISPSGLVSAGSWVNLTCSSRAKPPVSRFTWFKISKDGPMTVSEGPFYSVIVTDVEDYYCVATNDLGNQTSSVIHLGEGEELTVYGPTRKTEEEEEGNIYYGEIDFSKRRPEPSPSSVQDSGQQQDTLYAQIQVSKTANSLTQTAECPEDIYAQVKKK
ncbi:B-cell receptor CD22 B-lymphocyte cell adhesion molecule [Larimichthys crocea]|uniref:B-cell receptor CD22 B-lymphocyte cell adhesion molecule n=1 Tax=Larimichthys crocea TaxID=215358 RepID=A0A6G0HLV5_LARCR|nr:B-cell receptor CD22 B-lymphocyte cell adhesion molecule [Larimichthys crocea]